MTEVYEQRIFPVLTPLAVDPGHPSRTSPTSPCRVAAFVRDPETGSAGSPASRCPTVFPRLVPIDDERFLPAEQLIAAHLHTLFAGMVIEEAASFRVTRNADLTLEEEEADDLLEAVEMELRRRRFNRAVRLEVARRDRATRCSNCSSASSSSAPDDVYRLRGPSTSRSCGSSTALDRPDLKDRPWPPVTAGRIASARGGRASDRVGDARPGDPRPPPVRELHQQSTEAFIEQAADDPRVQSIKMTLYRAGGDSPIIRA